jgi:hypothetical protein
MRFLTISLLLFSVIVYSQSKTYKLFDSKAECQKPIGHTSRGNQRIISSNIEKDSLSMEIQYIENCANGHIINYSIIKDTILFNFDFDFTDREIADCECVFVNKLKIKNPKIKNPIFKINNTKGLKEIKLSNKYYLPAEYFIKDNDSILIYDDNGHEFRRTYYDSGNIKSLQIRKNSYSELILYYENGKIELIRQRFPSLGYSILRKFDENGKLIKYENNVEFSDISPTQEQQNEGALLIISKSKNDKQN